MEGVEWFGLFAPAGTPNEIVIGLNAAFRKSLATDAIQSSFGQQAFDAAGCTPAEFAQLIKSDREMRAATVAATGFTRWTRGAVAALRKVCILIALPAYMPVHAHR